MFPVFYLPSIYLPDAQMLSWNDYFCTKQQIFLLIHIMGELLPKVTKMPAFISPWWKFNPTKKRKEKEEKIGQKNFNFVGFSTPEHLMTIVKIKGLKIMEKWPKVIFKIEYLKISSFGLWFFKHPFLFTLGSEFNTYLFRWTRYTQELKITHF